MTADMIYRLTHKSYVINMNGNSYRMKETKALLNTLEQ
jgi:DNA replication protein DnaC